MTSQIQVKRQRHIMRSRVLSPCGRGIIYEDLSEILQSMLVKFINGNALKLYHNEITGVDALDWKAFPKALIVSDGKIRCDGIEFQLYFPGKVYGRPEMGKYNAHIDL